MRLLKTYTYVPVNFEIHASISGDEIKSLLTDNDYDDSGRASLYFKSSVFTKHQGVFYDDATDFYQ